MKLSLNTRYVYRLETTCSDWWSYFGRELLFSYHRPIDQLADHSDLPPLEANEDYCGVWLLSEWHDAVKFWQLNPGKPTDLKKQTSYSLLMGTVGGNYDNNRLGRIFTRIDTSAFASELVLPDKPLLHENPSSRFVLRKFNTQGRNWSEGELIPHISIQDQYVEVFYDGYWRRKSYDLGLYVLYDIKRHRTAEGLFRGLNL